jgi:hypothetical protein
MSKTEKLLQKGLAEIERDLRSAAMRLDRAPHAAGNVEQVMLLSGIANEYREALKEMGVRDDATIKRDAKMWSLVAELEALRCERDGMLAYNKATEDGGNYTEDSFYRIALAMREIGKKLEEV